MVDYTKRPSSDSAPAADTGSKVSLTKASPTVSLTKGHGAGGTMRINLNWNAKPEGSSGGGGGFMKRLANAAAGAGSGAIDLDLGCLYELADGRKGAVQALGNAFGATDKAPYIMLDGDDRSGTSSGGENLLINLDKLGEIKRVLVFAYIYEGAPAWDKADGVVTLYPVGAAPIEIEIDKIQGSRMCAIALLENINGELSIKREVNYINGMHSALDLAYGWGMKWHAGHK